jgi:hypothetical protein
MVVVASREAKQNRCAARREEDVSIIMEAPLIVTVCILMNKALLWMVGVLPPTDAFLPGQSGHRSCPGSGGCRWSLLVLPGFGC